LGVSFLKAAGIGRQQKMAVQFSPGQTFATTFATQTFASVAHSRIDPAHANR
jgi:hypothetical protein